MIPLKAPVPQPSPAPNTSQYVCVDDCNGECSGEVDGTPHCPKSPVPTSGTGTAPEGATVEQMQREIDCPRCNGTGNLCNHPQAAEMEGEGCPIDDRENCDDKCKWMIPCDECYPGMAKDIGDLTLRVDNLEKRVDRNYSKLGTLEKEQIKGKTAENIAVDRLNVHAEQISELMDENKKLESRLETCFKRHGVYETRTHETNSKIIELETALKALQEEVKGISITGENGTIYSLKVKREL